MQIDFRAKNARFARSGSTVPRVAVAKRFARRGNHRLASLG